jgi:hypothetical protein
MRVKTLLPGLATGLIIGALAACGGSGNAADNGPTMAQFKALQSQVEALSGTVSDLKAHVSALQDQVDALPTSDLASDLYVAVKAPELTASVHQANARRRALAIGAPAASSAANPCTDLGTLTGAPENANPAGTNKIAGTSCTGYLYVTTDARTGSDGHLVGLKELTGSSYFYTGPNCTGKAYRWGGGLSSTAWNNGAVFTLAVFDHSDYEDPSHYWYLPAREEVEHEVIAISEGAPDHQCGPVPGSPLTVHRAQRIYPNDPSVTGIDSAPIPGPIYIGRPGEQG